MKKTRSTLKLTMMLFFLICISSQMDNPLEDLENRKKCDRVLMQSFKLEGMKFPHKPQEISICPMIDENCCTVMDELTILKYWNEFSMEKWKKFVGYVVYLVGNIVNFQPYVRRLGIHNVPFFFSNVAKFSYENYNCSIIENTGHTIPFVLQRKLETKRIRNLKLTMLKGVFEGDMQKVNRYLKQEKQAEKKHLKNTDQTPSAILIDGMSNVQRKRFLKKMSKEQKQAYINANSIKMQAKEAKNKARYQFLRDVRVMAKSIERKLKMRFQEMKNKVAQRLDNYEEFLDKTKVNFKPILEKYQKNVEKFIDQGKFYIEQLPQMVRYDFNSYNTFMNSIKALMVDNLEASYDIMEQGGTSAKPDFMVKLLNKIKKFHLPQILVPKVPNLTFPEIEVEPLEIPKLQCYSREVGQQRNLLIINSPKLEFCSNMLHKVTKLKVNKYKRYLDLVKVELLRLISVKRGLYCVLCDVNYQVFIDKKKNLLLLDRSFCGNYISDFRHYFEFMNVTFIKYLDSIFQFINCVQSDGDELDFPFFTIIEKKKRMIMLWENCFDSLGTEDEFKHCYFICSKFKYDRNTPTIEGDLEFLKTVYFEIISFMRENKLSMVKTVGRPHKKIDWKMQEAMLVAKNKPFHHEKHIHKISNWSLRKAKKEAKKYETGRILEAQFSNQDFEKNAKKIQKQEYTNEDEYLYEKLLNNNENIYDNHNIFYKPTKVTFLKKKLNPERVLESNKRKLWINNKPLNQGFEPYIKTVKESLNLEKLKEDLNEEQRQKMLAKEEATPVDREIKKDEIFERIEMTVDLSVMDLVYLHDGDGINPMKAGEGAEFDIDPKKLIKQNLKIFGMEILHSNVIKPAVELTDRKIDKFNNDINMKLNNSKNRPHKFKNVQDGDWYKLEEEKRKNKLKGIPTTEKTDRIDRITDKFENLQIDLSKPDPTTVSDEMNSNLEKNPRVKTIWDQAKYLGR